MINRSDYVLGENQFHPIKTKKSQIMLLDTHHSDMKHFGRWTKTNISGNKKTTPYTISVGGVIYEHYDPENCSTVFGLDNIDPKIIPISVENMGWVDYSKKKKQFINWCGDIYGNEDDVFVTDWRGHMFWAKYTQEQMESLVYLINELCERFGIKKKVSDTNVYKDFSENFLGVTYKSNYSKLSTDINPSMNFNYLIEKIEL